MTLMARRYLEPMLAAARIGFADLAALYTLRTWIFGWFSRLVTQVIFFSLFGLLLGSPALAHYRVIGNSAALVCMEAMAVVLTVVRERAEGTLAFQLLAPPPFILTYLARGIYGVVVGVGSSTAAFVIATAAFRVPVSMPEALLAPVAIAVMGLTSYCAGLAIGAVIMARPSLQWLAANVGYLCVMTFAGVNVPVSYWSPPIQTVASALPLTHGLLGLRLLLAGGPLSTVAADLAVEAAVGAAWLAVAISILHIAVRSGRRSGAIELSAG